MASRVISVLRYLIFWELKKLFMYVLECVINFQLSWLSPYQSRKYLLKSPLIDFDYLQLRPLWFLWGPPCVFWGLRQSYLISIMSTWSYSLSTLQSHQHATKTLFLMLILRLVNYCLFLCSTYRAWMKQRVTWCCYYLIYLFWLGKVCSAFLWALSISLCL